ncbi:MAG: BA14K family protein [Alphaproteobacteria bacterium]
MLTLKHLGCAAIAAVFVTALAIDAADARRGGGGGMRGGGGFHGGGGMRGGGGGARFAGAGGGVRPSHPIARPGGGAGWANRPGTRPPGWAGRPGYGPGWAGGYRPGYGWGAAAAAGAVGAGIAYSAANNNGYYDPGYGYYDQGYSDPGYSDPGYVNVQPVAGSNDDAIAECARRFRTYDPATQTYIRSKGVRASCP